MTTLCNKNHSSRAEVANKYFDASFLSRCVCSYTVFAKAVSCPSRYTFEHVMYDELLWMDKSVNVVIYFLQTMSALWPVGKKGLSSMNVYHVERFEHSDVPVIFFLALLFLIWFIFCHQSEEAVGHTYGRWDSHISPTLHAFVYIDRGDHILRACLQFPPSQALSVI